MKELRATAAELPPSSVPLHWAMYSKQPGKKTDYSILSSTFSPAEAELIIRSGLTGHPDGPAPGEQEELPWLTFTSGSLERTGAVLMELDWSNDRDGTGQVIAPTRLTLVPWEEAAAKSLTYFAQYQLLRSLPWQDVGDGPRGAGRSIAVVGAPPFQPGQVVESIEEYGFDWCAAVAAVLMEGQTVAFVSGQYWQPLSRIRLLDAICGLLPYAWRAQLSAATWASHRVTHSVRMSFADKARQDQLEIRVDQRTPPVPQSNEGRAYLAELRRIKTEVATLPRVVEHLAAKGSVAACRSAEDALRLLLGLDVASLIYREIQGGNGSAKHVLWLLDNQDGWSAVPRRMRPVYFSFIVGRCMSGDADTPEAEQAIRRYWSDDITQYVAGEAFSWLCAGRVSTAEGWIQRAVPASQNRSLLLALTRKVAEDPSASAVPHYAKLLFGRAPGVVPGDPQLNAILLQHPLCSGMLIDEIIESPDRSKLENLLDQWREQLPQDTHWARPYVGARRGDRMLLGPEDMAALQQSWRSGLHILLAIAIKFRTAPVVFPAAWSGLMRQITASADPRQTDRIMAIVPFVDAVHAHGGMTLDGVARLDITFLTLRTEMPGLMQYHGRPDPSYVAELTQAWKTPELNVIRGELETRLLKVLTHPQPSKSAVERLITTVDAVCPPLRQQAINYVTTFLLSDLSMLGQIDLPKAWGDEIGGWIKLFTEFNTLCTRKATPLELLAGIQRLLRHEANPQAILVALRPWMLAADPVVILELLYRLIELPDAQDTQTRSFGRLLQQNLGDFSDRQMAVFTFLHHRLPLFTEITADLATRMGYQPTARPMEESNWKKFLRRLGGS